MPIAADESIRKAADPFRVVALGAADIAVVKVAPLGGAKATCLPRGTDGPGELISFAFASESVREQLNQAKDPEEFLRVLDQAAVPSTPLGDLAETLAIKRALGEHAYRTMVSSTKSMTGHLLGAAGGAEAIFSVMALHEGIIPPTTNLDEPGEGCDLDYVPNTAREAKIDVAMSNGFGFGGTNGTLVFKRV